MVRGSIGRITQELYVMISCHSVEGYTGKELQLGHEISTACPRILAMENEGKGTQTEDLEEGNNTQGSGCLGCM